MRIKHKRPNAIFLEKLSRSKLLWGLVAIFVFLNLCLFLSHTTKSSSRFHLRASLQPLFRELEQVEEENVELPPPRKRSPRAAKRKPKKPSTTLIDEFLDKNSQLRHVFFPRAPVDPSNASANESNYFYPGRNWLDTEGNPIQAHGGGILYDAKSGTYFWYGEYKDGPTYYAHSTATARVDIIGIGCYSSKDLYSWKNEGLVLQGEKNESHDLFVLNVLERPKVLYNDRSGKYVMWMHVDDGNYTKAAVGVAVSEEPTGPFEYLGSKRPHGFESRDMTVFKDEDGTAYLVYSSEDNRELHVGALTGDYLDVVGVVGRVLVERRREAPAVFKHEGTYYMVTSGCTGWAPNEAYAHAAESMMGPWETLGNPCVGGSRAMREATFFSQGTFVLPVAGVPGLFVFMADRWNAAELRDSRYVWLPLLVEGPADRPLDYAFGFPTWSRIAIYWHRKWRLPVLPE